MRKKIIAGNWKMNLTKREALHLFGEVELSAENMSHAEIYVFPPTLHLDALRLASNTDGLLNLGAQNFYPAMSGAFTGEISINHLLDLRVNTVLVGHSERRVLFYEDDFFVKKKVDAAIQNKMIVFFCCGEPEEVRNQNKQNDFIFEQLQNSLLHLSEEQMSNVIIAYEPVWAIGTGKTASKEQANEMHVFIRSMLKNTYGESLANQVSILYGGSCNTSNAADLFAMSDIDGGLIGGASLKAEDFISIINAAK